MKIILNNHHLSKALGPFNDVGFVPTMGGIHEGKQGEEGADPARPERNRIIRAATGVDLQKTRFRFCSCTDGRT